MPNIKPSRMQFSWCFPYLHTDWLSDKVRILIFFYSMILARGNSELSSGLSMLPDVGED